MLTLTKAWPAIHFRDASLRHEAATGMDIPDIIRFIIHFYYYRWAFSWRGFLKELAYLEVSNSTAASAGPIHSRDGEGCLPRSGSRWSAPVSLSSYPSAPEEQSLGR